MQYNHLKLRKPYLIGFDSYGANLMSNFYYAIPAGYLFLNCLYFEQFYGQVGHHGYSGFQGRFIDSEMGRME